MRKKYQADNRGFTLIELIVAIAISAIVLGSVWQFIITGTKTYSSQKDNVDLQVEVQQTMNQLQNLIVDANRSIACEKTVSGEGESAVEVKTLNVYSSNKLSKIIWNQSTKEVTYQDYKVSNGSLVEQVAVAAEESAVETEVLAQGVTSFLADVSKVESDNVVKLELTFEKGKETYVATRNITLRNRLITSNTMSDIYAGDGSNGTVSATIQIIPNEQITLSQRASYDFNATINDVNSGNMEIIWTIGNQTSGDTSINIENGVLSIGASEQPGNIITVTATLAADRNVKTTTTVKVEEAVPEIYIVKSPKYVLRGTSYASAIGEGRPIEVKIVNAEEEYTLSVDDAASAAGIRVDGTTLVIPNELVGVTAGQVFKFGLTATTVATPQDTAYVEMTVRDPEFEIVPSDPTSVGYIRGSEVTLTPDWSKSAVVKTETIGETTYEYTDAVYNVNSLNATKINWTYTYVTRTGQTTTVVVPQGQNKFTVPTDIAVSGGKITVTGVSALYGAAVTDTIELSVADVNVSLRATVDGISYGTGQNAGNTISVVSAGNTIALRGDVLLYSNPQIVWSIYEEDTNGNRTATTKLAVNTLSNTRQDANVQITQTSNYVLKDILGKTFVVRVADQHTGIYQEVKFTVQNKVECDAISPQYIEEYLVMPEGRTQISFNLPVVNGIEFSNGATGKWNVETGTKPMNTYTDPVNRVIKFEPTVNGAAEGTAYTYDIDSDYTGQHLLRAELTRGETANYFDAQFGNERVALWLPRPQAKDVGKNTSDTSGECDYINFTVGGQQVKYTYSYVYERVLGVAYECRLTISVSGQNPYTVKYVNSWGTWKID